MVKKKSDSNPVLEGIAILVGAILNLIINVFLVLWVSSAFTLHLTPSQIWCTAIVGGLVLARLGRSKAAK